MAAAERAGDVAVIALPWLRDVDGDWLERATGGAPVIVLDNHFLSGGQGDAVRAALGASACTSGASSRVPAGGGNDEVLRAHRLDASSLAARLEEL